MCMNYFINLRSVCDRKDDPLTCDDEPPMVTDGDSLRAEIGGVTGDYLYYHTYLNPDLKRHILTEKKKER